MVEKRGLLLQENERRIYIWGNYENVLSRMLGNTREFEKGGEYYKMNLNR